MENLAIRLNFFALDSQDISLNVYRQPFHGQPKQSGYYKAKLPKNDTTNEYGDYWVATAKQDGFERYFYSGDQNPNFTVNIIWEQFVSKVQQALGTTEYTYSGGNGFVRSVDIVIARHPEGNEVIEIQPYYLKAQRKYGLLVDFAFRKADGVPFSLRIQQYSLSVTRYGKSNINYYSDKLDKIRIFTRQFGTRLFPLTIGGEEYTITEDLQTLPSDSLKVKTYVFADGNEGTSQAQGITSYGPLEQLHSPPLIVCIFHPRHRDVANTFYSALTGKEFPQRFSGMEKMFGVPLSARNFKAIHINSLDKRDLHVVEQQILMYQNENPEMDVIGVFLMDEHEERVHEGFSSYHYVKYLLTKHRVPLQAVRIDKIMDSEKFQWSIGNIGLQIFAKLGGIPWKVKPSNQRCIILGVGSAHKRDEQGNITKHFAYSVCVDSSGIYKKVNILGNAKNRTEYIEQLRANIQRVIAENVDGDTEKCVIHLPFKLKHDEMNFIQSGVKQLSSTYSDVQFQFIKINTKNKFFGYAENNNKVPYESSYIQLSNNDFVVWFEGLQYNKTFLNRKVGNPVHVEFLQSERLSTAEKRRFLQDIINLSGANWRGFNSKLSPISIFYPNIIADFIAEFRQINPTEDININDFYLPWFL